MFFNFHDFVDFPVFLLLLISNVIPLGSEKMFSIISVSLNPLTLDLWPNILSILENVPCALEKNVYSVVLWWSVLYSKSPTYEPSSCELSKM